MSITRVNTRNQFRGKVTAIRRGTVNADVLDHYDDSFTRDDFVETILSNGWPE